LTSLGSGDAVAGGPEIRFLGLRISGYPRSVGVTLVDYDPRWGGVFSAQRDAILAVGGAWILAIEHFGSTAVPGLVAKPIVDIAVSVASVDVGGAALVEAVAPLGYVPFDAGMPGRLMCTRDVDGVRVQHLHILPEQRWELLKERLFRDWLLTHPADRDRYAAVKLALATQGLDGLDYTRAKTAVIQEIVDAARAARGLPSVVVWEE
jgi:GrpB-like predicted nucleotidyltransferase (UPF0157 family)